MFYRLLSINLTRILGFLDKITRRTVIIFNNRNPAESNFKSQSYEMLAKNLHSTCWKEGGMVNWKQLSQAPAAEQPFYVLYVNAFSMLEPIKKEHSRILFFFSHCWKDDKRIRWCRNVYNGKFSKSPLNVCEKKFKVHSSMNKA